MRKQVVDLEAALVLPSIGSHHQPELRSEAFVQQIVQSAQTRPSDRAMESIG
jgi:hypothetical protein